MDNLFDLNIEKVLEHWGVEQEDNKFKVSGQFKLIKNIDRVALAQYCLKKQAEREHNV